MEYVRVLLPSIVVGLIFWYVMRAVIKSDSIERKQMDKYYAQLAETETAKHGDAPEATDVSENDSPDSESGSHGSGNETRSH